MSEESSTGYSEEYSGFTLIELITAMDDVQKEKGVMEERLKAINSRFDYLRLNAIPTMMDSEGVGSLTLEGIGRVGLTSDVYASIKSDKKEQAWEWLQDTGHGDLITETVNPSSLKAALKQMATNGEEIPEELFNFTPFTRASITRKGVSS